MKQNVLTDKEIKQWKGAISRAIGKARSHNFVDIVPKLPKSSRKSNIVHRHTFSGFELRFSNWVRKYNSLFPEDKFTFSID